MGKLKLLFGLIIAMLIPMLFGSYIPELVKAGSYALSITIKQILLLILPFIIFSFIFSCLLSFKRGVIRLVLSLTVLVFISNLVAICCAFLVGTYFNDIYHTSNSIIINKSTSLMPLWDFHIQKYIASRYPLLANIITNKFALIAGFLLGIYFSVRPNAKAQQMAQILNKYANLFLKKVFIPIIPLFILGFVFQLEHENVLAKALNIYGPLFFVIVGTQISYMVFIYNFAAGFNFIKALNYLKNVFPATLAGFTTISSAASLPVLILCSQKNAKIVLVETVLPATINIHTLGSAIGITILSITTLKMFNMPIDFMIFLPFALYYALAKFAVAAVPGGVLIVVYPLLEAHLGFTPDMLGIITAMYLLFDPFGTATNVTGNGAFVIIFEKIANRFLKSNAATNVGAHLPSGEMRSIYPGS